MDSRIEIKKMQEYFADILADRESYLAEMTLEKIAVEGYSCDVDASGLLTDAAWAEYEKYDKAHNWDKTTEIEIAIIESIREYAKAIEKIP